MLGMCAAHHSVVAFAISRIPEKTQIMKLKLLQIAITLAAGCGDAQATEYGHVISSVVVQAQVGIPQQQCVDQPAIVQ